MEKAQIFIDNNKRENTLENGWFRSMDLSSKDSRIRKDDDLNIREVREYRLNEFEQINIQLDYSSTILLIPLVNDLQIELRRFKKLLSVGLFSLFDVNRNETIKIIADKDQPEGLFFLIFIFDRRGEQSEDLEVEKFPLGGASNLNELISISVGHRGEFEIFYGAFLSKNERALKIPNGRGKVFSYCLDGCFEVAQRMLFSGDGLSLSGFQEFDIECLSHKGLIILFVL